MFDKEYFNYIEEQILIEKFQFPRHQIHPPPVLIIPEVPVKSDIKIPIPIKEINEEFHIKKLNKKKKQNNKKKIMEIKNYFSNNFLKNQRNNNTNNNGTKNDFSNYMIKSIQKNKIFIIPKEGNVNNIFLENTKTYSNKTFNFTQIKYKFKKLPINKIVPRAYSMDNIKIKINNLIDILYI